MGDFHEMCRENPNFFFKSGTLHEDLSAFYCRRRHQIALKILFILKCCSGSRRGVKQTRMRQNVTSYVLCVSCSRVHRFPLLVSNHQCSILTLIHLQSTLYIDLAIDSVVKSNSSHLSSADIVGKPVILR
jgi:hypothetical protein